MKSPELRKELSELVLHKRGIRNNLQLSVIEAEEEIQLRSAEEVYQRLVALWLTWQALQNGKQTEVSQFILRYQLQNYFSSAESQLILHNPSDNPEQLIALQEALHFIAWAAGLHNKLGMPSGLTQTPHLRELFSELQVSPDALRSQVKLRSKSEILDNADLLFRLHWAVRHAHLTNKPIPGRLHATAVHTWHRAVNWLISYDNENDWDKVSTETAG